MVKVYPINKLYNQEHHHPSTKIIGSNKIWLNCFMTGPGYYAIPLSALLIIIPSFISLYIYISTNLFSDASKVILIIIDLCLFCLSTFYLLLSGLTEPGIIYRNYNSDMIRKINEQDKSYFISVKKGHLVKYSICYSCNIVRPIRTSHCAECDNCTERFDHHCIWIGQCVGKRNYSYFLYFLIWLNISMLFHIVSLAILLSLEVNAYKDNVLIDNTKESYANKVRIILCSFVLFFVSGFSLFFLTKLMINHVYYACRNTTFYENLKKKFFLFNKPLFEGESNVVSFFKLLLYKVPKSNIDINNIYHQENKGNELIRTY